MPRVIYTTLVIIAITKCDYFISVYSHFTITSRWADGKALPRCAVIKPFYGSKNKDDTPNYEAIFANCSLVFNAISVGCPYIRVNQHGQTML